MSCHVMSCHVMSCHVTSCHVISCHVMSCHVMSCHVVSNAVLCRVISNQVVFSLAQGRALKMYAIGPFCASCGSHLQVQTCSCQCSNHDISLHEVDHILTSISEACKADTFVSYPFRVHVNVSTKLCFKLWPVEVLAFSFSVLRCFPYGILIFTDVKKNWILFRAPCVQFVSPRQALVLLLFKLCLGFAVRPQGLVQIHVFSES